MSEAPIDLLQIDDLMLLETVDHLLNRGLVVTGDIVISVANVDLIYVGLNLLIASAETVEQALRSPGPDSAQQEPVGGAQPF